MFKGKQDLPSMYFLVTGGVSSENKNIKTFLYLIKYLMSILEGGVSLNVLFLSFFFCL